MMLHRVDIVYFSLLFLFSGATIRCHFENDVLEFRELPDIETVGLLGDEPLGSKSESSESSVSEAEALEPDDIATRLQSAEGVDSIAEEPDCPIEGARCFEIWFRQPIDHDDPCGPSFRQRIGFVFRDVHAPTLFLPSGYDILNLYLDFELTSMLEGNQVYVEHRFYPPSSVEPTPWPLLTTRQSAADHHRIIESIRPLLHGAWISAGVSQGGLTVAYHRRYYPDDVDATVSYVAPLYFGADPRQMWGLRKRGTPSCRRRFRSRQREALQRRDELIPIYEAWAKEIGITVSYFEPDQALEYIVASAWASAWYASAVASPCEDMPPRGASAFDLLTFLIGAGVTAYDIADQIRPWGESFFYQSSTEVGYPTYDTRHLRDLLTYNPNDLSPLLPEGQVAEVDLSANIDLGYWIYKHSESFMFIYGEYDTTTFASFFVQESEERETYKFTVPEGNHFSMIADLPDPERSQAIEIVKRWAAR